MKDYVLRTLFILFIICLMGQAFALFDSNIKSWWKLDTNTGEVTPDYKLFNAGTASGALNLPGGLFGNDYNFKNDSDHIDLNGATWQPDKNFTLNVWVKTSNSKGNRVFNNYYTLNPDQGWIIDCGGTNNAPRFGIGNGTTFTFASDTNASHTCDSNSWRMITATYDGNSIKLYVDGVFAKDASSTSKVEYATAFLSLGGFRAAGGFAQSFTGQIDEVSVYETVLPQADITYLWNDGIGTTPPLNYIPIDANYVYSIDKSNSKIILINTSTILGSAKIDYNTWKLGDTNIGTTPDFNYTVTELTDYNIGLRIDTNVGTTDSFYRKFNTGDWSAPTTSIVVSKPSSTTYSIRFTCSDNNIGCRYTTFKFNSGDWNTQLNTGTLDINTTTSGVLYYYSSDMNDNNETAKISQLPAFTYTNVPINSFVSLYGASLYNGVTITDWNWLVNNVSQSTDQNYNYVAQPNQDINICLKLNTTNMYCEVIRTWDTVVPTIDVNIINSSFGFVNNFDINYSMLCYDNYSPIQYDINWNDGTTDYNLYSSNDANGTVITNSIDLNAGQNALLTFTCTDDYNNIATYSTQRMYAILLRLINEDTGVPLTYSDINTNFSTARVYTPDGNYSFDFNANAKTDINFFSPTNNLYFEFGYKDASTTKINRQIDYSLLSDSNIGICVPFFQTFYQQRFVSNSAREMVLQNNVSHCYVVVGTLDYVYDTGYSITTYTVHKPYYLYIWINGVKTFLALIEGAVATQYNLDAIAFSRTSFDIVVGQDTVGFAPLLNTVTGLYDTNTIQIYYKSYSQDNASITWTIKNGTSTVWNYTDTNSPNELLVNFYYGGLGINDQNVLELIISTTDSAGNTTTRSYYFTTLGAHFNNQGSNEWVVIIAVLFFLFGITLVAANKAFGIFGIVVCIMCMGIIAIASGAWWISFLQAIFLILTLYIVMMGKTTGGQLA